MLIYSPPHSNMHFIEHLVHSKTELTERRGGPRLQPPRYPRRRWLREARGGGAGGRRAPRRGRGAARSRRPARGPRPRAAPLRSRRCGGAPRTGAARAPAAQARARSFRRDGRGAREDEGLGGVTAAAAPEEEYEVRRRSCVSVGARGRRREARRSAALAQRSMASGAGLVSSMADAASPLGVRAGGLGRGCGYFLRREKLFSCLVSISF